MPTPSYTPVGGSLAPDLTTRPPHGYRPREQRSLLGHGGAVADRSADAVLRWQIQERVGIQVVPDHDQEADPRRRGDRPHDHDPIRQGDLAVLHIRAYGVVTRAPVLVVAVVDEPRRRGFAYGTLPGHPESGEVAFLVERGEDDRVELVVRSFSRPATPLWRLLWPFVQWESRRTTRRYLEVLVER